MCARRRLPGASTGTDDSDAALLIAAALRGLRLHSMPGNLYGIYRIDGGRVLPLAAWKDAAALRTLLGAKKGMSLRSAAERDGLRWPDSPAALLDVMAQLSEG